MRESLQLPRSGILLAAVLGLACGARASVVVEGKEPPNVAGAWFNYDTTTLKDLRGLAVLLEFWGST